MSKKIYVGNFPWSTTEEDLEDLFSQYGEVQSVKIITDRATGRSKGFGFIEMTDADKAIAELNGKDYNGRNLRVDLAVERNNRR